MSYPPGVIASTVDEGVCEGCADAYELASVWGRTMTRKKLCACALGMPASLLFGLASLRDQDQITFITHHHEEPQLLPGAEVKVRMCFS